MKKRVRADALRTQRSDELVVVGYDHLRPHAYHIRKKQIGVDANRAKHTTAPGQFLMATASPPNASRSKKLLGSSSTHIYISIPQTRLQKYPVLHT